MTTINLTKDYVLDNVTVCLQRKTNEDIIKKDFLDLEQYYRVKISDDCSFKMTQDVLSAIPSLTLEEVEEYAFKNAKNQINTFNLGIMFGGVPEPHQPDVCTNNTTTYGANALLFPEIFKKICERNKTKSIFILPSSVHEVLAMPDSNLKISELNEMVREVNRTEVREEDVLSDHAYIYNVETNRIYA